MKEYDLIAIGAGSAGIGASGIANAFGLKALMIDKKDFLIGGDCLNFGCVPSKALIHVSRLFAAGRQAEAFGLQAEGKADFKKVMEYVHARQDIIRKHENAEHFRDEGIDVALGHARFTGPKTVEVEGATYTSDKIVLATGSRPRKLDVKGIEKVEKIFNNESFFWEMKTLPDRLLIVGGGPIGCELGQAMRRLGSEVTIVNRGEQLLSREPKEISDILQEQLEKEGITIYNQAEVSEFTDANTAVMEGEGTNKKNIPFDAVLTAIGREVRTQDMGLETAGIEVKDGEIVVDEYYRTTNKHVWAIGDAAGMEKFSHGAEMHNRDLANNFVSPFKKKHSLEHFSWVTFTEPEVATFGYSEKQLKDKGIDYKKIEQSFAEDDRAITGDYRYARMYLYISPGGWFSSKRVLGGVMVSPMAGELIQELLLANIAGTSINKIFNKVYPYPVASRINQKAIREEFSDKLTPTLKKILGWLFKL